MATTTNYELKMGVATREAFGRTLAELGKTNKDIVVCDADLSKSTMTTYFAQAFPDRFFTCGIAESNMTAVAAGLAAAGKIPVVASFSCFMLNKGFEQLRVTVAYPNMNVKVVGTHSGISIGEDGPSQMSVEDLALAGALPGFVVLSPADEVATRALVAAMMDHVGPVFLRAGRPKVPVIYSADQKFEIGKAIQICDGRDVTIIATGALVAESIRAAEALETEGVSVRVIDIHTIKPIDRDAIALAAKETGAILVAEEHLMDCGLGTRVAQVVSETNPCIMGYVGINNTYAESGTPEAVVEKYGLLAKDLVVAVRNLLARKK